MNCHAFNDLTGWINQCSDPEPKAAGPTGFQCNLGVSGSGQPKGRTQAFIPLISMLLCLFWCSPCNWWDTNMTSLWAILSWLTEEVTLVWFSSQRANPRATTPQITRMLLRLAPEILFPLCMIFRACDNLWLSYKNSTLTMGTNDLDWKCIRKIDLPEHTKISLLQLSRILPAGRVQSQLRKDLIPLWRSTRNTWTDQLYLNPLSIITLLSGS